jgi:hypothetical protein
MHTGFEYIAETELLLFGCTANIQFETQILHNVFDNGDRFRVDDLAMTAR